MHSTYKKVSQFKLDQWIDVASKITIVLSWRLKLSSYELL